MDGCFDGAKLSVAGFAPCYQNDIPTGVDFGDQRANDLSDLPFDSIAVDRIANMSTGGNSKPGDVKCIGQIA